MSDDIHEVGDEDEAPLDVDANEWAWERLYTACLVNGEAAKAFYLAMGRHAVLTNSPDVPPYIVQEALDVIKNECLPKRSEALQEVQRLRDLYDQQVLIRHHSTRLLTAPTGAEPE